ncbi:phosphatidylinositol-specific phospholipase C/glycerophosphodiester phosphodiesterase family protein [Novipirellula artificiosorum]|uniref:Altered inheritance of mitochondria protein 6 n=1 Tax=Novipirellula artificiosorum TaxID=2528016 RepID=A0A5C6DZR8_9BACT|nr:phosphatidylinositol-specific phospholipase C/glycerophosphodiester phosphodiesterase family protein [Novipirellula artificiosorum]TWU40556.1 hypothetical protein Poly41_13890 [Novipirellula artificiosorum]
MNQSPRLLLLFPLVFALSAIAPSAEPLRCGHSHNDYTRNRPLQDALDHGFCSVEADVFSVDGELMVAHAKNEIQAGKTLRSLYLDPLRDRITQNDGRVYRSGPELTLFVDVKDDAEATYQLLRKTLKDYRSLLTRTVDGDQRVRGALTVIVSGNRAESLIFSDPERLMGMDGRIADLDRDVSSDVLPMISDRWGSHFKWQGEGEMPEDERQQLRDWVAKAHQQQRRIRFWATPEKENVWKELLDAKVDLINTDHLTQLQRFIQQQPID